MPGNLRELAYRIACKACADDVLMKVCIVISSGLHRVTTRLALKDRGEIAAVLRQEFLYFHGFLSVWGLKVDSIYQWLA